MLILKPAIMELIEAGIMILKKVVVLDCESNFALLINSIGIELEPKCVFTQSGNAAANEIENTFEKSPMPKNVIKIGSIATGGNALNTLRTGVRIKFSFWFLPVRSPNKTPIAEPMSKPEMPRQIEV